jgi:GntR family transcriptional regulator, transcriptional repressor for pyruvate dehydrogenase complex
MANTAPATRTDPTAALSTAESVFERILADIVRAVYPPGARLPAERELARTLGASRPTLREALRRLSEWQLVEARRGSGIVVRDRREWSIEVLPAYLRYGRPLPGEPPIGQMLIDLLDLRRAMIRDIVRLVAGRIPAGGTDRARELVGEAWELRADHAAFAEVDFGVMRAVVEAARFLPAVWVLNRLAGVYLDVARSLSGTLRTPEDYVQTHERVFAALEGGDADRAAEILDDYLGRHDQQLRPLLGGPA